MKVEFEKKYLRELYEAGRTTDKKHRYQPQVVNGYLKCVKYLIKVMRTEDLFLIKSLNYEKLKGNKKGLSSVRINDRYRLEFRETIDSNEMPHVEIYSLVDITNHYK
jgi:proteic killer suppression protein